MQRNVRWLVPVLALALFGANAGAEEQKHEELKAPHGGQMLEVGEEVAHLEVLHDAKAGKMTLYVIDKDGKTPLALKDPPRINIRAADGNKQVETKPIEPKDGQASQFEAVDEALKTEHLNARVAMSLGDKKYNVRLDDGHGH